MRRVIEKFDRIQWCTVAEIAVAAMFMTGYFAPRLMAQQQGQKTFASAEEAGKALVAATESNDEKAMLAILGPGGKQIISSGDETEDAESRATFVKKYQQMHRLLKEPDGTVTLYVGAENWPTPIPIANKGRLWFFDTESAKKEILYRRVGRNELSAIRVCEELAAAQKEYYASQGSEYAQKILSDEGQHNGLYWKAAAGQPESPIGPMVAWAVTEAAAQSRGEAPAPYRGYFFHILTKQGKNVPGGAKEYIANGKMTEGFAFVAYPAEYRSSGVMTFVVGSDGAVLQKDLGRRTEVLVKSMKEYDPDSSWQKAEDEAVETAGERKAN